MITATPEPDNTPPRVQLLVDTSGFVGGTLTVTRTDPDGSTVNVRATDVPADITDTTWLNYDHEAPFGAPVTYTAVMTFGATSASSSTITLDVTRVWMIHPGDPTLSYSPPRVRGFAERERATKQGKFDVLGRREPVVTTDGQRGGVESKMQIRTGTFAERDGLWALLEDCSTILLNVPAGFGWGLTTEWISVDKVTETRIADLRGADQGRLFTLPYVIGPRPVGSVLPERVYADLPGEATTYAELAGKYASYLDVRSGTQS